MAVPDFDLIEGKYQVLDKLREGGMGAVYRVRHRLLDEIRVVKVIRPQLERDRKLRERFLREARSAVQLRHPNIAVLHDFSIDDEGVAFMVMECIEGEDLKRLLVRYPRLPVALSMEIGLQILRALKYLHASGFVHRDISPDNIMLTRDVEGRVLVKLIDLGVAKSLESSAEDLTRDGIFVGKYRYGAPEQFGGSGLTVDRRTDLYSMGVVLYELLTGEQPFPGDTEREVVGGHLFHPPRPFDDTDPDGRIPEELRAVVLRALEKTPEDRFQDADEFGLTLRAIQDAYQPPADEPGIEIQIAPVATDTAQGGGTTQWRLDNNFAPEVTPPPIAEVLGGGAAAGKHAGPRADQTGRWLPGVAASAAMVAVIALLAYLALRDRAVAPAPPSAEPPVPAAESVQNVVGAAPAASVEENEAPPPEPEVSEVPVVVPPSPQPRPPSPQPAAPPRAAAPDPRVSTLLEQARVRFRSGDDAATLERLDEVLRLDPDSGPAARLLRDLAASAESHAERARRTAESAEAAERAPSDFARGRELQIAGGAQIAAGRHRQAVSSFQSSADHYARAARAAEEAIRREHAAAEAAERETRARLEAEAERERAAAKPAPAPSESAADRRTAILGVLDAFAAAHEALDIAAVRAVWPSLSGDRLRALSDSFEGAREMGMRIEECVVESDPSRASAQCRLEQTYRPKRGTRRSVERRVTFRLVRQDGAWRIADY